MARLSIEQRIAQLEARKQALKARLNTQERAKDTRRKVLLGALVLDALERHRSGQGKASEREFTARIEGWIAAELSGFLTRPIDRALFPEYIEASAEQGSTGDSLQEASSANDPQPVE